MSVANYIFLYNSADRPLVWLLPFAFFETNKAGNKISWGMSGKEADPAALFRLYINYGRHAEATNLLVEYLESFASSVMDRQTEISKCKIFTILTYKSLGPFAEASGPSPPQEDVCRLVPVHGRGEGVVPTG